MRNQLQRQASKRARLQSRDDLGRFTKDRTLVIIDEFGNTGPKQKNETKFGFGVSILSNPSSFAKISQDIRDRHNVEEYKAHEASIPERVNVSEKIRDTDTKTYACYVDKNDLPEGMLSRDKYSRIGGMLGYTLDKTLPKKGNFYVIIDFNKQYKNHSKVCQICEDRCDNNRKVEGRMHDSVGDGFASDLIQTHDYVCNAARINLEQNQAMRSRILGIKYKKANSRTNFKEKDMK